MKIVEINSFPYGSTGKIMLDIASVAEKEGHEVWIFYRNWKRIKPAYSDHCKAFGYYWENGLHYALARLTGYCGQFSILGTIALLQELNRIQPDVIHLHNLHDWYINVPMLFSYIKKKRIRVIWTLHDCWPLTGKCPHFTLHGCNKWRTGCYDCPQHKLYPQANVDRAKIMWRRKKAWFSGVKDMDLVTPSRWLSNLVKESFLSPYDIHVINNGIDLNTFKPTESDFRAKYGIKEDEYMLLGVSFGWGVRKGLDVFIELSKRLSDHYKIVLVGTNDVVDKQLSSNIISIHCTQNQIELAEIYSASDLFVNPTREEVFGMVNIEALACGTPVVTFRTGGSPEVVEQTGCGIVVECNDINALQNAVEKICEQEEKITEKCIREARCFSRFDKYQEYIQLYTNEVNK